MEVTVTIPDEFVGRLIPAGTDASRALLEQLVDRARHDGRIGAEEAEEILGRAVRVEQDCSPSEGEELTEEAFDRYLNGTVQHGSTIPSR